MQTRLKKLQATVEQAKRQAVKARESSKMGAHRQRYALARLIEELDTFTQRLQTFENKE